MDWTDFDFVADIPPESEPETLFDRTGWEEVVFELEDEETSALGPRP